MKAASSTEVEGGTIIFVIFGHGEIPYTTETTSEESSRLTPFLNKKASTAIIKTQSADIKRLSDLSATPENLNIVKYSWTAPGVCAVGTLSEFYRQFQLIIKNSPGIIASENSFLNKIKQIKQIIAESTAGRNDLSSQTRTKNNICIL